LPDAKRPAGKPRPLNGQSFAAHFFLPVSKASIQKLSVIIPKSFSNPILTSLTSSADRSGLRVRSTKSDPGGNRPLQLHSNKIFEALALIFKQAPIP